MIGPKCVCGKELNKPGALLFGPPQRFAFLGGEEEYSEKVHLCTDCFKFVAAFVRGLRGGGTPPGLMWWARQSNELVTPENKQYWPGDDDLVPVIVVS